MPRYVYIHSTNSPLAMFYSPLYVPYEIKLSAVAAEAVDIQCILYRIQSAEHLLSSTKQLVALALQRYLLNKLIIGSHSIISPNSFFAWMHHIDSVLLGFRWVSFRGTFVSNNQDDKIVSQNFTVVPGRFLHEKLYNTIESCMFLLLAVGLSNSLFHWVILNSTNYDHRLVVLY